MPKSIAVIGAGVSGLTCAVVLAERGYRTTILAEKIGQRTTSGAAAAIWFPYDAEPEDKVIDWALETYKVLVKLKPTSQAGVSMIELWKFSRAGEIEIPHWANVLGARRLRKDFERATRLRPVSQRVLRGCVKSLGDFPGVFSSGYSVTVPLTDTTIYLDYLANRFRTAGGTIQANERFEKLEDVSRDFDLIVNCSGIGARTLVQDDSLEPHRGQIAVVPKLNLSCAVVCDDPPLMYVIPRANDCVFGGTNEVSDECEVDPATTTSILTECTRALNIDKPKVVAERVGLRPFRKSGVRLERGQLHDDRSVIHNYGHGGSGFTLSWGCAAQVLTLVEKEGPAGNSAN